MPKNLLLADDSRTIQQAVRMTFAREDVRLTAVEDGEAALQAARDSRPDLIIADVNMPRLGGYELCQRVRADAALREVPVLLFGGGMPIDPAKAMAVGANGHMPKPFDSGKLIEQVKAILANPSAKSVATAPSSAPPRPLAAPPPRPSAPPPARPSAPPPPARPSGPPAARPPGATAAPGAIPRPAPPRPASSAPPVAARPGTAAPRPPGPPGARSPAPVARPAPALGGNRPAMSAPAKPAAQARPTAPPLATRPAPPRPPVRPPAPPAFDDEEIPVDEDLADEPPAAPPTPLRSVPSPPHSSKPSLSVVPPAGSSDGGEAALREALSRASREVIEKIAWEVVPELAETIIREELERLIKERGA